ncbi:MAG: carboxypeptidase regulatory-like domain-containing protein, partial [Planctomycetia bacterium]|nr:carboxypeptidase regulatory-like domain-containing protein [Planctomycetia bacterium]
AIGVVALALATRPWSVVGGDDGVGTPTAGAPGDREAAPSATAAARADVLAGARASRPEDGGPLPAPVAFDAVDRERDLHGVVVDADGRAVAGATLTAVSYPAAGVDVAGLDRGDPGRPGPSTRSASDGTFALRLRPGVEVGLRVTARGFAPVEVSNCLAGARVRVTLHAGVALRVTAKDPEGRPVEGVAIRVFEQHPSPLRIDARATTDAAGVARIGDLPPSTKVWAEATHPTRDTDPWTAVLLPASGEVARDLVSRPGRTRRGRVVDAGTGAGIGGARVGETEWMLRSVMTDADGGFVFAGWEEWGNSPVCVEAEGYARAVQGLLEFDDVTVALARGGAIVGRVTDGERRPVRDAEVFAIAERTSPIESPRGREGLRTRTGGDGRFVLGTLSHDRPHTLVVMAPGFGRTLLDVPPRADGPGRLDVGDVVLPAGRRVAGRVRTVDGGRVAGATVTLVGANDDRGRLRHADAPAADGVEDDFGRSAEAHTDDLGRFGFADLAPGAYVVRVEPPGMSPVVRDVTVPPTGDVLDVELIVGSGRPFRVTVEDDAGVPVPWAWVHVLDSEGQGRGLPVDARGVATGRLPEGELSISVGAYEALATDERQFVPDRVVREVEAGSGEMKVVLDRAKPVSGRVVGPDGAPLAHARVEVFAGPSAPPIGGAATGQDGAFEVLVPVRTPVDLWVTWRPEPLVDWRAAPERVARLRGVVAGARDVLLRATAPTFDRAQTVLVVDETGRPVHGARVGLERPDLRDVPPSSTDADGHVTLTGLPDLPVVCYVGPPAARADLLATRTEAAFPDGGQITVRLARGRLIAGRVVSPQGTSLGHLRVRFTPRLGDDDRGGSVSYWIRVDASTGRFAMALDPKDWASQTVYAVAAAGPHEAPTHRSPHVEVGPEGTEVVLVLEPVPPAGR